MPTMKKNAVKLIAPLMVTLGLVAYFTGMLSTSFRITLPPVGRIIAIAVPLALIGVSIYVLIERIKEIRSGDEDDLGKY
jgi:uncharacterized membrane protein